MATAATAERARIWLWKWKSEALILQCFSIIHDFYSGLKVGPVHLDRKCISVLLD
jgi:hypothetical protein